MKTKFKLLDQLPAAPIDRTGWPWTEASDPLPSSMPDGSSWPRITIVTPSLNQGRFIEETIRSILLQGYPNLEYIVIDGGSGDESVEVIRKYSPWITYWVSEKDCGQADAIQKGIDRSSGEIFNWINSDDLLTKGALEQVAKAIRGNDIVCSEVTHFSEAGLLQTYPNRNLSHENLLTWKGDVCYQQPGCWLRLDLLNEISGLDRSLHYVFDYEMMLRFLARSEKTIYLQQATALFRLHDNSKTVSQSRKFNQETLLVLQRASESLRDPKLRSELLSYINESSALHQWYDTIDAVKQANQSRILKSLELMLRMLQSPRRRINRFSAGALRQILLGQ